MKYLRGSGLKCPKNSKNAIHLLVANKGQFGPMPNVSDAGFWSTTLNKRHLHKFKKCFELNHAKGFCFFK